MANLFRVPDTEIRSRISSLQSRLCKEGVDALFIAQRVDLFYFTGTAQNAFLFVPARSEPALFVRKHAPRARRESPLSRIEEISSIRELPDRIENLYGKGRGRVGFEMDVLSVRDFEYYKRLLSPAEAMDGSPLILELRAVKSPWEMEQMDKAAALSAKTFRHMASILRPGLTELEFAGMAETFARKHGHGAMLMSRGLGPEAYPWHVLAGKSGGAGGALDSPVSGEGTSPAFPSGAGHRKIAAGEPILVDFGTVLNRYHMDETRMFAIGSMPQKAEDACRAAIRIHDRLIEKIRPGIRAGDLFDLAVDLARGLGYEESFLGLAGEKSRFVGHGIGAELVEPPFIAQGRDDRLTPGMTLALEPKMCVRDRFAAGIESVVAVTQTGSRLLSKVPVDIFYS